MPTAHDDKPGLPDDDRAEHERVQKVYTGRYTSEYYKKIWIQNPVSALALEDRWRLIAQCLQEAGFDPSGSRVLDLGAGTGADCVRFARLGCPEDGLVALDLLETYISAARRQHPWLACVRGDATRLPLRAASVDLVFQSTMISSILDDARRAAILAEASRVLVPGGWFLSYDTRYPNPWNPHTRPLRASELRAAFQGWSLRTWSVTGIPHLMRLLAPISMRACRMVESVPFLRSHLVALARKPPGSI